MVKNLNPIPKELKLQILKTLPKNIVEELTEFIHDSWWEEKINQGFHHPSEVHKEWDPQNQKEYCSKCHLDMIPYDKLPANSKILDKVTIETTLAGLILLGYDINFNHKREKFDIKQWKDKHNIE